MQLTKSSIARVCGLAVGVLLAGCGSSGSGGDATAPFVGSWTYSSGSIQPNCNIQGIPPFDLTGDTMTVTKVNGNTVATSLKGNGVMCNINFTVSGDVATAVAGQTCAVSTTVTIGTPMTIAVNIMITTWTLTVSGDTLSMAMTGTASAEGGVLTCNPTASGTASKPADAGAGG